MSSTWVVNASPLIVLAKVGRLDLLSAGVGEIVVPVDVLAEVLAGPADDPARRALEKGWGRRVALDHVPAAVLEWGLGAGESSVLGLAISMPSPVTAILDDGEARMCARALGVAVMGTLGVILRAKRGGSLDDAATIIRAVRAAGLRLDDNVISTALAAFGEAWSP